MWELGYLGNRSTYRIKTESGKLVTVFAQNERRTLDWSIDWSDEVYLSLDGELRRRPESMRFSVGKALKWLLAAAICAVAAGPMVQAGPLGAGKTRTVVLIVSDGLRWQEVFTGAEADLLNDKEGGSWVADEDLRTRYWRPDAASKRRRLLFPFLWGTVAKQGQIFGNQALGQRAPR